MKKLVKLLISLLITTPLPVTIVACGSGGSNGNEISENTNIQELLDKAKSQIPLGISSLVDKYKNLTFDDEFTLGTDITSALNKMDVNSDTVILDRSIKDAFLNRLQDDMNKFMIDKFLVQPTEFKPLFGSIPFNDILKIDINQTILTKKEFKWNEKGSFGVDNYDPINFNINMWHKVTAQLAMKLTYKNENNNITTTDCNNNYPFSYANKGANLRDLVNKSTDSVETVLKGFMVELNNTVSSDNNDLISQVNQVNQAKLLINNKISTSKFADKVTINTVNLDNIKKLERVEQDIYRKEASIMCDAISKTTIEDAIDSLKGNFMPIANNFATSVNTWVNEIVGTKPTVPKDSINAFGKCIISDWAISGLRLKQMTLDFLNARSDQTQVQWAEQSATALCTIFFPKGNFAKGRIDLITGGNLTMYMNSTDFDNYTRDDKTLQEISDYINLKINTKAKNDGLIKRNISVTLSTAWNDHHLNDKSNKKIDDNTLIIPSNNNKNNCLTVIFDNIRLFNGSAITRSWFNNWIIKRADTNVLW